MVTIGKMDRLRGLTAFFSVSIALGPAARLLAEPTAPTPEEMALARSFFEKSFGTSPHPPFSFRYGSDSSDGVWKTWPVSRTSRKIDSARVERTLTWRNPVSGLRVRCKAVSYRNFPVVEWTVYYQNSGRSDTLLLDGLSALDTSFERGPESEFRLNHHVGTRVARNDYEPLQTLLPPGKSLTITPAQGRPCAGVLPYFNLQQPGGGVIVVVGWPGKWSAEFKRDDLGGIRITAGQENVHCVLRPGEEIRTPLIVLQFWHGEGESGRIRAQNLWRRWMVAHNLPRVRGKLPPPQITPCSSHQFGEMIHANEENQKFFVDRYVEEGFKPDYWWMDAGWYVNQTGWPNTGTWEVDKSRFPGGLRAITDHARRRGVRSLVWFEPERVTSGTWLAEQHPEWLIAAQPDRARMAAGLAVHRSSELSGPDPCVIRNSSDREAALAAIRWEPGALSLHPGPRGEFSVVRWTAPQSGEIHLAGAFTGIDQKATTDVRILHAGRPLFRGYINLHGGGPRAEFQNTLIMKAGESLDFVVGWGNGSHICDSTGLSARISLSDGSIRDASRGFSPDRNPSGEWRYGFLEPGPEPNSATFRLYDRKGRADDGDQRLLDLGNARARAWLTDHVDRLLREQGIDLYRQDFNIDPLPYWRANDAMDRQGITENHYITGYLAYWDELRRRHPDMLIDSCASGGHRNDLETLRRSVPLLRSDYIQDALGNQGHTYGLACWFPFMGTGTDQIGDYELRSAMAGCGFTSCWDMRDRNLPYDRLRRLSADWRLVAPSYMGDFYPLTPYGVTEDRWIAWQFDRPEDGEGVVQAYRHAACASTDLLVRLGGLEPAASYRLTDLNTSREFEAWGRELMESGLSISIRTAPGAAWIHYRKRQ